MDCPEKPGRAWLEISLENLRYNYRKLCSLMPSDCKCMAVVKADAYGHGAVRVAQTLQKEGCDAFAVATVEEGIKLRTGGIAGVILVLGYTMPRDAVLLEKHDLTQTIVDEEHARGLAGSGALIKGHLAVDTGMNRLGIPSGDVPAIERVLAEPGIRVTGIYSHMSTADGRDAGDVSYARAQIRDFLTLRKTLCGKGYGNLAFHMQGSYGLLLYPMEGMRYARPGIALYGCESGCDRDGALALSLRPVLELKSRIGCVREVHKGGYVSYGRTYRAKSARRIATATIGYADGLPRCLSGCGYALLKGRRIPIVGRICMDQTMLDVTEIPGVEEGDVVTFIGEDESERIKASAVARTAGTITNELFSRLGGRLTRTYTE